MKTILILVLFLYAHDLYAEDEVPPEIKKIEKYTAIINFLPEEGRGKLTIKKGQKIVYKENDGYHYYFGLNSRKDKFSGKNITGNKIPNLVITNFVGGLNCCVYSHIFELGERFRKIITLYTKKGIELVDLDLDKVMEIELEEEPIYGVFASIAGSPAGRVVLKYINNDYKLAPQLMKKPPPTEKQLKKLKNQIVKAFKKQDGPDLPYDFLKALMDLSYTGHLDMALKIADETWPPTKEGLPEFKKTFISCLNESEYWKAFSDSLNKSKK